MSDQPDSVTPNDGGDGSPMAQGIALARAGDQAGARAVFRRIIHQNQDNEDAWLWLAWVAESRAHSLRYLREAQALLPDSQRIEEAMAWASQDAVAQVGTQDAPTPRPAVLRGAQDAAASSATRRAEEPAGGAAGDPAAALGKAMASFKDKLSGIKLPTVSPDRLRSLGMPLISVLAVVALVLLVLFGIQLARNASSSVLALTLPTPVPNATATPSVDQRTDPLWVQVEIAMGQANWEAAAQGLEQIRAIDPESAKARSTLAAVCYQQGVALIQANDLEGARAELDKALRLDSSYEPLQEIRRQLKLYTDGVAAYWAKDWPLAVQNLKKSYAVNPDFRDCKAMLAQAYYELALERADQQVWEDAKDALDESLTLDPERAEAQTLMTRVMDALIPPNRIVVDLGDQTVTVYEAHAIKYTYRCCTGRSTAPTVPGRYAVQSKLPSAYASVWDLDMPWWLGIYWAGGSENGFHAVPLLSGRQVLWRSSMGTPCSFGCIVLDTPDALQLYEWAEIGVTVLVER